MIYNGKILILNLRVTDLESEKLVFNDYFGSIEELNSFLIDDKIDEPLIPEINIDVCNIENDSEIILLFSYELTTTCPLDEEEIEEFYEVLKQNVIPIVADLTPKIESSYKQNDCSKTTNKPPLLSYNYLCPHCWNELENCTCPSYPYFLVQIDVGLVEIVKTLNRKGYFTAATCEGHIEENAPYCYINFQKDYNFDLPEGFYWDDYNIRCKYKGETLHELTFDKKDKLEKLFKTVENLPSLI